MEHQHRYDEQGRQLCCTLEEKIYKNSQPPSPKKSLPADDHDHDGHDHDHAAGDKTTFQLFLPAIVSLLLLLTGLYLDKSPPAWYTDQVRLALYILAYLPVGLPVIKEGFNSIRHGEVFSEFFLMTIATIGAFAIGEYPEGVAVMLFYTVGEVFQTLAVSNARKNIKTLIDQRPDQVTILNETGPQIIPAADAVIGDRVQLRPGEKLALDGMLIAPATISLNTAALTGESMPATFSAGDTVLAGMVNLNTVAEVQVTTAYEDSKLSKILEMVQHAAAQKAPTELFIRKFAKIYTPIVVFLAAAICFLPYFFVSDYNFHDWLYRSLVFLVVSCPCALVISIPLGYFGGIGAASRNGILIKGGNFLDVLADVQNVVMDKTGTVTKGVFEVQQVVFASEAEKERLLPLINALESQSTHPVATAIQRHVGAVNPAIAVENTEEIPGNGLRATVNGKELLVGNFRLMDNSGIAYNVNPDALTHTVIAVAYDGKFAGYLTIADSLKDDAVAAVAQLKEMGVKAMLLSGDRSSVVQYVADQLGIPAAYGDLLPEDKVNKVREIKEQGESVAFVGDGLNDAPVIALSDVGMAMGGLGSDATIETADVVIQDDRPRKIPMAINIGKQTKKIVWQNIGFAFFVKLVVLILGAGGLATMWEAVFADVGVALIAIFNAIRIQRMTF